jgi:nitrogen fixation NifU-like protein
VILDHYRNPRNHGILDPNDASSEDINTLCGDLIRIDLRLTGEFISDVRFSGLGCAISLAATSLLTERIKGSDINGAHALSDDDLLEVLGVPVSPSRRECALLGLHVLRHCIASLDS